MMTMNPQDDKVIRNAMVFMGYPVNQINYFVSRASGLERQILLSDASELGLDNEKFVTIQRSTENGKSSA